MVSGMAFLNHFSRKAKWTNPADLLDQPKQTENSTSSAPEKLEPKRAPQSVGQVVNNNSSNFQLSVNSTIPEFSIVATHDKVQLCQTIAQTAGVAAL
jgi:hypothetical protein